MQWSWNAVNRNGLQWSKGSKKNLRARGFSRDSLLKKENTREGENKITFNLIFYPVFQNVKNVLVESHILLTSDVAHNAIFTNVPIIDF